MTGDTVRSRTRWAIRYPNGTIVTETAGYRIQTREQAEQAARKANDTLYHAHSAEHAAVVHRDEILLTGPWETTNA